MKDGYGLAPYTRSFFEDHLVRRRNLSRNSIWSYRDAIKLLIQFATERTGRSASTLQVEDIDEPLVLEFLKHLEHKRGNSIQTCNHRLMTVRSLFEYIAFREPLLAEHCRRITTIPLKRGARVPQIGYLTRDEMQGTLAAVDRTSWKGRRDYVLLLYMYNTGSRVQEVVDARISWLSLHGPYKVEITGKGNKSRICPLWDTTAQAIEQYIRERAQIRCSTDHLFLKPVRYAFEPVRRRLYRGYRRRESLESDPEPEEQTYNAAYLQAYDGHALATIRCRDQRHQALAWTRERCHHRQVRPDRSRHEGTRTQDL
jgi:site-specific recombinase XerD